MEYYESYSAGNNELSSILWVTKSLQRYENVEFPAAEMANLQRDVNEKQYI